MARTARPTRLASLVRVCPCLSFPSVFFREKRAGVMRSLGGNRGGEPGEEAPAYLAVPVSGGLHLRAGAFTTLPLRRQRVHTRIWRTPPSTLARTRWRLGSQVREVTLCAWLTLRPKVVPLPQISHCLAMFVSLLALFLPGPEGHVQIPETPTALKR